MTKGLEALDNIKDNVDLFDEGYQWDEEFSKLFDEDIDIIEKELKGKEQQDSVLKTLKEVIAFDKKLPDIEINDDGNIQIISGAVGMSIRRQMESRERELLRKWVLETCFPKELKELEELQQVLDDFKIHNTMNLIDTLKISQFLENDNHFYKYMISSICEYMGLDIKPFEDLVTTENAMKDYICENECFRVEVATNKNKLKALKIIIKKNVDIFFLKLCETREGYNAGVVSSCQLTQEEYNLLKEVLL